MLNWGMDWGMGMKKLTARFVDSIKEPGKYYDANNLFLRVYKAGSKSWVQRITINGKRREMGLGIHSPRDRRSTCISEMEKL